MFLGYLPQDVLNFSLIGFVAEEDYAEFEKCQKQGEL